MYSFIFQTMGILSGKVVRLTYTCNSMTNCLIVKIPGIDTCKLFKSLLKYLHNKIKSKVLDKKRDFDYKIHLQSSPNLTSSTTLTDGHKRFRCRIIQIVIFTSPFEKLETFIGAKYKMPQNLNFLVLSFKLFRPINIFTNINNNNSLNRYDSTKVFFANRYNNRNHTNSHNNNNNNKSKKETYHPNQK